MSREQLQQNKVMKVISKKLAKEEESCDDEYEGKKEEEGTRTKFWEEFDKDLKRGIRKIPGVPIMYLSQHRYSIERMPDAYGAPKNR